MEPEPFSAVEALINDHRVRDGNSRLSLWLQSYISINFIIQSHQSTISAACFRITDRAKAFNYKKLSYSEGNKSNTFFYVTLVLLLLATAAGFSQNSIREVWTLRVAIAFIHRLIWIHGTVGIIFCGWENGGEDCWDWHFPKSLLWLPWHGSWGEEGSRGGGGTSRRWMRSIDTSRRCEQQQQQKNQNSHMEILTT